MIHRRAVTWHIITGEYPPGGGGVSDYTHLIASGLAAAGDPVHVWCPRSIGPPPDVRGVHVHAVAGGWRRRDLERLDSALDGVQGDRKLLVQWVPHAFGRRSLNVAFCRWIRRRAMAGDALELMVHEPFLPFRYRRLRHDAAAAVHRLMTAILLAGARRVWVAIPAWTPRLRPWTLGRTVPFCWLPVPSTIPVVESERDVGETRHRILRNGDGVILGHFGTYSPAVSGALRLMLPGLLRNVPDLHVCLLGRGGERLVEDIRSACGPDAARLAASGELSGRELSCHIQAADLMLQPYPDGASTRRTTLMAALAHGRPVVTTVGPLSEPFWTDSGAVAVSRAGDLQALARHVTELARDPERRRALGASARATYDTRFSVRHVVDALRSGECPRA